MTSANYVFFRTIIQVKNKVITTVTTRINSKTLWREGVACSKKHSACFGGLLAG
jgi:hypothetical protein